MEANQRNKKYGVLLIVILLFLFSLKSYAQFQRIGVYMGEELIIGAEELSGVLPSVCLDENFAPPDGDVKYEITNPDALKVYIDDSKIGMSFNDALKNNYINYSNSGYNGIDILKGENAIGKEVTIKATTDTWFETPKNKSFPNIPSVHFSPSVNPEFLTELEEYKKIFSNDLELKQNTAWHGNPKEYIEKEYTELQKDLKETGYYKGPVDGTFNNTKTALQVFNIKNGFPSAKLFGEEQSNILIDAVEEYENKQYEITSKQYQQIFKIDDEDIYDQDITPETAKEDYKALQTELKEMGYYAGSINGGFNTTKSALEHFNIRNNFPINEPFGIEQKNILEKRYTAHFQQIFDEEANFEEPAIVFEIKDYYKNLQSDINIVGLYNGVIDGSFLNTKIALENLNSYFKLPIDQPLGKAQRLMMYDLSDILNFYKDGEKELGSINYLSELAYAGQDNEGYDYFITSKRFIDDDNFKTVCFKCKKGDGTLNKLEEFEKCELSAHIMSVLQENYANKLNKINKPDLPILYVGNINANNEVNLIFNGVSNLITLDKSDLYNSLLSNIKNRLIQSGGSHCLMELDFLQKAGIGDEMYENTIIQNENGTKFINYSRLASDLTDENNTVFVGTNAEGDYNKFINLSNIPTDGSNNALLIFDPLMRGNEPSEAMKQQYRDKGLNVIEFKTWDDVNNADIPLDNDIIITVGHHDEFYKKYLTDLGDRLENKILVSYSCKVPGDISFYSDLISNYGLKLVIHFPDEINPIAINAVLQKLGGKLNSALNYEDLLNAWLKATEDAMNDVRFNFIRREDFTILKHPNFQFSTLYKEQNNNLFDKYGQQRIYTC